MTGSFGLSALRMTVVGGVRMTGMSCVRMTGVSCVRMTVRKKTASGEAFDRDSRYSVWIMIGIVVILSETKNPVKSRSNDKK